MSDDLVTRREFDALASRVTAIDEHGSRGVQALTMQLAQMSKDIGRLEKSMESHEKVHTAEAADRRSSRRWIIATVIAAVGAVDVPLVTILLSRH